MRIEYSSHVQEKMQSRAVLLVELLDTVFLPDIIRKRKGQYFAQRKLERGTLRVVYEASTTHIKVITLYWM